MEFKKSIIRDNTFLEGKTSREEPLDDGIAAKLVNPPNWLIPCQVSKDLVGKQTIYYNITGKITLSEYFATLYLPVGAIRSLLRQIIAIIDTAGQYQLPLKNIVFDYDQAYFDSALRKIQFVYLPVEGITHNIYVIRDFFCGLSSHVICADEPARRLMDDYNRFFQFNPYLSLVDFRDYLQALVEGRPVNLQADSQAAPQASARRVPQAVSQGTLRGVAQSAPHAAAQGGPSVPGMEGSGRQDRVVLATAAARQAAREPAVQVEPLRHTDSGTTVLGSSDPFEEGESPVLAAGLASGGVPAKAASSRTTTSAPMPTQGIPAQGIPQASSAVPRTEQEAPASTQGQPAWMGAPACSSAPACPSGTPKALYSLEPVGGGACIAIEHDGFVIGKSVTSDYQITGNDAVSRRHARFLINDEGCFINDLGSTNRTYVRGKAISPDKAVRLVEGCRIKLGNEEFIFHAGGGA